MDSRGVAQRIGFAVKGLMAASLFFVLICWWVSAGLFAGGAVVYGVGWVIGGGLRTAPASAPSAG